MAKGIIIFFEDGSNSVTHFYEDVTLSDDLVQSLAVRENRTVKNWSTLDGRNKEYMFFLKSDGKTVDVDTDAVLKTIIAGVRAKRNTILQSLDTQYIISSEKNDVYNIERIKCIKNFYRNIPEYLSFLNTLPLEQLEKINPFGNIVWVRMLDGGSKYTRPPRISFPSPENGHENYMACGIPKMEGDSVASIAIAGFNCGYAGREIEVFIEHPGGDGKPAKAIAEIF